MKRLKIDKVWIFVIVFVIVFWSGFFLFNWVSPYAAMFAYMVSLFILMLFFKYILKRNTNNDEN